MEYSEGRDKEYFVNFCGQGRGIQGLPATHRILLPVGFGILPSPAPDKLLAVALVVVIFPNAVAFAFNEIAVSVTLCQDNWEFSYNGEKHSDPRIISKFNETILHI